MNEVDRAWAKDAQSQAEAVAYWKEEAERLRAALEYVEDLVEGYGLLVVQEALMHGKS